MTDHEKRIRKQTKHMSHWVAGYQAASGASYEQAERAFFTSLNEANRLQKKGEHIQV